MTAPLLHSGLGVILPSGLVADPAIGPRLGRHAESLGFDSLWCVERLPPCVGGSGPTMPAGPRGGRPDPLVAVAHLGGVCGELRLGAGVLGSVRRARPLARQSATLQWASGGRLMVGVGVGGVREEIRFARDAHTGAEPTDEYIQALRMLWQAQGIVRSPTATAATPEPTGLPGLIPIVVGGWSVAAARRAGRLGDGHFPLATSVAELVSLVDTMRAAAAEAGRDPMSIPITVAVADDGGRAHEDLAMLGVANILLALDGSDARTMERQLDRFGGSMRRQVSPTAF